MPGCKAQYGTRLVCGDLLFPGGAYPDFWVGYISDLGTPISGVQSAPISSLSFVAYTGLVRFDGQKFAHAFSSAWNKGAGGNGYFTHRSIVKLLALSTQDDVEIQRLLQAQDAFIVYGNNNDQLFISGYGKGLASVPGDLTTTGVAAGDDVTDTVTLEGAEKTKPVRFDSGSGFAASVAYLNARVI